MASQGNAEALISWFNDGADGQIDWGESGSFMSCVSIAGEHMDDDQAKGFCAERHHDATGHWPGEKKTETATIADRITNLEAAVRGLATLEFGDFDGHPFRGNQWTDGTGEGGSDKDTISDDKGPTVSSAREALELLSRGEKVTLPATEVSSLVDQLAAAVKSAAEKGEEAPNINLCNLTVPDTNLFCAESKDVPRIEMPQLKGIPDEGSKAYEKYGAEEVDLGKKFRDSLEKDGFETKKDTVDASFLKATQNELNGAKVARFLESFESGEHDPKDSKIYVSSDNYVLDGHHHWAAAVAYDYEDAKAGDVKIGVIKIDMPITELLDRANAFTEEWGIPHAAATVASALERIESLEEAVRSLAALEFGDLPGHPFRGNQYGPGTGGDESPELGGPQWRSGVNFPEAEIQPEERVRFVRSDEIQSQKGSDPVGSMITQVPSPFGKGFLTMEGPGAKEYADIFNEMLRDYDIFYGKDAPTHINSETSDAKTDKVREDWQTQISASLNLKDFEYLPKAEKQTDPSLIAYATATRDGVQGFIAGDSSGHNFYTQEDLDKLRPPSPNAWAAEGTLEFGETAPRE